MRVSSRPAFSLIEILVVIAIIGILSTIGLIAFRSAREAARIAKARHEVDALVTAIKTLEADTGQWPEHQTVDAVNAGSSNEVWDLSSADSGLVTTDGNFPNWNGPYMQAIPLDPWGNRYFMDTDYQVNGSEVVVVGSFGPNGVGQNVYDSDNIYKILR